MPPEQAMINRPLRVAEDPRVAMALLVAEVAIHMEPTVVPTGEEQVRVVTSVAPADQEQ